MMATVGQRLPLTSRTLTLGAPAFVSPLKTTERTLPGSTKRPRSPDLDTNVLSNTAKRAKAAVPPSPAVGAEERKAKEQRRAERELQRAEFKAKYTKAFPSWSFYFDLDHLDADDSARELLESKISHLGGHIEDFFSNEITHLITNQSLPSEDADKENKATKTFHSNNASLLRSPVKLGRRVQDPSGFDLVEKAQNFGIKVWNTSKLESVLQRCLTPTSNIGTSRVPTTIAPTPTTTTAIQRSLTRLLESERLQGATTERDPTQKRHDYRYFSKGSCFVLVEDMRGELATIAALEYPLSKGRTGDWPVLHCHPHARGPFVEFDEKEKKRWHRSQKAEKERTLAKEQKLERMRVQQVQQKRKQAQAQARKTGDLRRSVSMNNLQRRDVHLDPPVDLDADCCDNPDSANASGYLASAGTGGYLAASGNSMGITSTTGTTSTTGFRGLQLPASLRGRIQQQIVTSRKFHSGAGAEKQNAGSMGPPVGIPERPTNALLRKSRSTNTLKLEKREEGSKPGYCESCRMKFDDFRDHIIGRKHRKFAVDDSNFLQLDFVLARVQRRTTAQVEEENQVRKARRCGYDEDGGAVQMQDDPFVSQSPQDQTPRQYQQLWTHVPADVTLEEM